MSISLPQGLALGTALIGVGAVFSETVSGGEEVKPLLSASSDTPKLTYNNEITNLKSTCRIYEVERKPQVYEVTRIVGEITKERLAASLGSEADKFIGDMKKACDGNTGNFKIGDKVYVYIYKFGNKWTYSTQLQGRDWNQHVAQKPITTLDK